MQNVAEKAKEMNMDLEAVKKAAKSLQSQKCRLLKQKGRKDYNELLTKILQEEQLIKEVRAYIEPKKTTVTTMTIEQINDLDYEETIRAIKSIQSKKCLVQYEEDQVEYNKACEIEEVLKTHRATLKPTVESSVSKNDINDLMNNIAQVDKNKIDKNWLLEQLKKLAE